MPLNFRNWLGTDRAQHVIIGLHFLLLLAIFLHQGILADKEAMKYIGCAQNVLAGDPTDLFGNYAKYGAYVLFLLPFVALGVPGLAVLAQMGLGVLAALALARLVMRITASTTAANAALALLLLCLPLQQWTLALYTEALFTSMSILFIERVTRPQGTDGITLALAATTLFARPVGMLFVGPALIWKFTGDAAPRWLQHARWPSFALVLLVAVHLPGIRSAQLEPIVDAHIVAGYAEDPGAIDDFNGSSIVQAQLFLLDRHGLKGWSEMFVRRIASLFTLTRGHYSTLHNWVVGPWMLLYPLAIWGLRRWHKRPEVVLITVMLVLHTVLVGLTHDEWSGRFMAPLLPWVIFLAVLATQRAQHAPR